MPHALPTPRRARHRNRHLGMALAVLAGLTSTPASGEQDLEKTLGAIETAFRSGDAGGLRAVLPRGSKVLLDLESYSRPTAYYGPEQVVLILQRIFREFQVVRFHFHRDGGSPPGSRLYYVPAEWSGRDEGGGKRETRVQFMLIHEEGAGYRVCEIKEVR